MTPPQPRRHDLRFPGLDRRIDCREDESVYAAARRAGLRIVGACGGRGACGTCVVRIAEGRVHREGESAHKKWVRACRIQPRSDLSVEVAPRSLAPVVRADLQSGEAPEVIAPQPSVEARELALAAATLADCASDADRLAAAFASSEPALAPVAIEPSVAIDLPGLLRAHQWRLSARYVREQGGARVVGVARPGAPRLGLAVDLGTTNAAAFLVDLASGQRLASLGVENPQVAWGADLVSRIHYAVKNTQAAVTLRQAAIDAINALAHDLLLAIEARAEDIVDVTVCGNTAMQHLLAGWPVAQLGRAPFVAAMNAAASFDARAFGLAVARGAQVSLAPSIGGFVGGDHVSALLATEQFWLQPGTTLVMDIGTNTEISIAHGGRIWSASCPSGPALEGGHIGSGMRAAEGAIERVRIAPDGKLHLGVIGNIRPIGLCGSGVLDALAAFVRAGWVDARGRIVASAAAIGHADGVKGVTLAPEIGHTPAVRFDQGDVRAVQLAKSAIRTGVKLLAAEAGTDESAIERFVIAGAFGAYIDVQSAIAIGLFPPLASTRFTQVGNAAGLGVQQMLASCERRSRAAAIARECRYIELSTRGDFQKTFLDQIGFPQVGA